jgi:hypothetical protein
MGRLSEYSEEEQAASLRSTNRDSLEEFTPDEEKEFLILDGLSKLGIEAAENGFEDLSSALADLEFLFVVGYDKGIAERLRTVADEVRSRLK